MGASPPLWVLGMQVCPSPPPYSPHPSGQPAQDHSAHFLPTEHTHRRCNLSSENQFPNLRTGGHGSWGRAGQGWLAGSRCSRCSALRLPSGRPPPRRPAQRQSWANCPIVSSRVLRKILKRRVIWSEERERAWAPGWGWDRWGRLIAFKQDWKGRVCLGGKGYRFKKRKDVTSWMLRMTQHSPFSVF